MCNFFKYTFITILFCFFGYTKYFSCRDFRHEKTKKKRGTYRGGLIDLHSHSVKFNYSDEEWLGSITFFLSRRKIVSMLLLEHHAIAGVIKILLHYGLLKQCCSFGQRYFNSFANFIVLLNASSVASNITILGRELLFWLPWDIIVSNGKLILLSCATVFTQWLKQWKQSIFYTRWKLENYDLNIKRKLMHVG